MVERCGDRQRKFDGLEKWRFRGFIESLPIMLQIALLLLMCGLSRYVWSVNTSVGPVIIFSTVLGVVFYIAIVAAGMSSYECPFQTPASIGLRHLKNSGAIQKLLTHLVPPKTASLICTPWKIARQVVVLSGIHSTATKVGHQIIILLLRIDRAFGNAKQWLVQRFRRRAGLLPTTAQCPHNEPPVPRHDPRLLVRVRNLETLRKQNTNNARCVSWVLRSITDPEAIAAAIRLAGTIRWFDGGSDHDPPFDFIVSTFEACFDSSEQLYPGMKDRAYLSARAILQINMRARAQSQELASKYPFPAIPSSSVQHTDPDLHHIIRMFECNSGPGKSTLAFPRGGTNTHAHLLWMSTLFVDVTRVGPNPILESYESYLSVATANHRPTIANLLLMWYMLLGGRVEEETFWAVDKSYAVLSSPFLPSSPLKIVHISDSLEPIISCLSTRVVDAISNGNGLQHLNFLLEFLAAWEKRPVFLTPIAYQWCSAVSEAAGEFKQGEIPDLFELEQQLQEQVQARLRLPPRLPLPPHLRLRLQDLARDQFFSEFAEEEFSHVGPACDPTRLDNTSYHTCECPQDLIPLRRVVLLSAILEIGFRLTGSGRDWLALPLDHTPHHEWIFELASYSDDELLADAVSIWIVDGGHTSLGSCAHYLAKRADRDMPFSPRLRQLGIRVIEHSWRSELEVSEWETVRLLNCLNADVNDTAKGDVWAELLVNVIHSPVGLESLSPHYWRLLDKLVLAADLDLGGTSILRDVDTEVMRSLERARDWEKLEVWMVVLWLSQPWHLVGGIDEATLGLLLQRPSGLPRFEGLCRTDRLGTWHKDKLQRICDQVRATHLPSGSPPLYVSVHPAQYLSILISFASVNWFIETHSLLLLS